MDGNKAVMASNKLEFDCVVGEDAAGDGHNRLNNSNEKEFSSCDAVPECREDTHSSYTFGEFLLKLV